MAWSSSPVLPGDVEWLPGPGGARLLRINPSSPEPPVLILRCGGEERRIEATASEYVIPAALDWSAAWLQWPDGTRAAVPAPNGTQAEVIELRPWRTRHEAAPAIRADAVHEHPAPPAETAASGEAARAEPNGKPAGEASPAPGLADPGAGHDTVASPSDTPRWTSPPPRASRAAEDPEAVWSERHRDLARDLAAAAAALGRARLGERAAREAVLSALASTRADLRAARAARAADLDALATITGELDAERSAHAVTRGSIGTLADSLAAARAQLASEREIVKTVRAEASANLAIMRAEASETLATMRAEANANLATARAENASLRSALEVERAARAAAEAELRERAGLLRRIAELDRAHEHGELEARAREQAEAAAAASRRPPDEAASLLANLDAAAAALRAAVVPAAPDGDAAFPLPADDVPPAPSGETALVSAVDAAPLATPEASRGEPPSSVLVASCESRLRHALLELAREDAEAAGALLVGLLPAQGALVAGSLSYDLTVRGTGIFAISVDEGTARVTRLSRRRGRREAEFHLIADSLALAELLAGERRRVGRLGRRARLTGRRKRARALAGIPAAQLSLAEAVRAGAQLEPMLVYGALPFAIEPEWTRGSAFTVAQRIVELAPQAWYISARDGQRLHVVAHTEAAPADATVTMSQAAFERLLRNEPHPAGDRPTVHGDREAVAALKRWTDLARGA